MIARTLLVKCDKKNLKLLKYVKSKDFYFSVDRLPAVCSCLPADAQARILTSKRKRNHNRKRATHKTG